MKSLLLGEVLSSGNDTKNEFKRILENRLNIVDSSINDFTSRIVNTDESRLTEVEKENVTRVHVSMLESQSLKKILSLF